MGTCFSADSGGGGAARAASSGKKGGAAAGGGGPSVKDDYVQGSKLGEGAFGVTYAAKSRATGEDVAIKKVDKRKLRNAHDVEQVREEVKVQKHLKGEKGIVELKGDYEDNVEFALVMEVCKGGELFDRIIARHHYTEADAAMLSRAMLGAIERMHARGVAHRDLKPENFLFLSEAEDAELKLTDFGLSQFFQPGETFPDVCGTAYYVAPEVLVGKGEPKSDVWSVGVITYILLCGEPPFNGRSDRDIFQAIHRGTDAGFRKKKFQGRPWSHISKEAKDAIIKMCTRDPAKRPSAADMLAHKWITGEKARDTELTDEVVGKITQFSKMNKLKKVALLAIGKGMSAEEQDALRKTFQELDANGDGQISFEELQLGLRAKKSMLGAQGDGLVEALQAMDIDNSGSIDYEEWLASTVAVRKLEHEAGIKAAFMEFDSNGDGHITPDEIQKALEKAGEAASAEELQTMLKEADTDNSGSIDYDEFLAMLRASRETAGNDPLGRPRSYKAALQTLPEAM